jgi:hypothetical protein
MSRKSIFFAAFMIFFIDCNDEVRKYYSMEPESGEVDVNIKLDKVYYDFKMEALENTLNDTALIGIMKLPPGKEGTLFRVETMSDTSHFQIKPYKATKGRLKIVCIFSR